MSYSQLLLSVKVSINPSILQVLSSLSPLSLLESLLVSESPLLLIFTPSLPCCFHALCEPIKLSLLIGILIRLTSKIYSKWNPDDGYHRQYSWQNKLEVVNNDCNESNVPSSPSIVKPMLDSKYLYNIYCNLIYEKYYKEVKYTNNTIVEVF